MADLKISQLTGATTPLAGTEVLPIVQSSSTKKVAVSDLTAGRSVAALSYSAAYTSTAPSLTSSAGTALNLLGSSSVRLLNGTLPTAPYAAWFQATTLANDSFPISLNPLGSPVLIGTTSNAGDAFKLQFSDGAVTQVAGYISGGVSYVGNYSNHNYSILVNNSVKFTFDTNGNLVPSTAAKGVNFTANTPAAGMTSQLLNWYEEGTWTPTQGAGLTVVGAFTSSGTYTRIGRQVTVIGILNGATSIASAGNSIICSGLPFSATVYGTGALASSAADSGAVIAVGTDVYGTAVAASTVLRFSLTYFV